MTVSHSSLIIDAGQLLPLEGVGRRGDYPVPTSIFFPSVLHYDGHLTPDNPPAPCRTILLRNVPFCSAISTMFPRSFSPPMFPLHLNLCAFLLL